MAKTQAPVTWLELTVANMTKPQKQAYAKMLAARKAAQEATADFEATFTEADHTRLSAHIVSNDGWIAGQRPMWSYRFGKLSIAYGEDAAASGGKKSMKL